MVGMSSKEWTTVSTVLKETMKKSKNYSSLHEKESYKYSSLNSLLNISNILITSISATMITSSNNIKNISPVIVDLIAVIFSGFLLGSTLINSLQQVFNFEKRSESHKTYSVKFMSLGNNIERVILLSEYTSESPIEFFKLCTREYEYLVSNSPDLQETPVQEGSIELQEVLTIDEPVDKEIFQEEPNEAQKKLYKKIQYETSRFMANSENS